MTNELKEKILECLSVGYIVVGEYLKKDIKPIYGLPDDQIDKLLAIIDEGIDEAYEQGIVRGRD